MSKEVKAALIAGIFAVLAAGVGGIFLLANTMLQKTATTSPVNADTIAGNWIGTIKGASGDFSTQVTLAINTGCTIGSRCGTVDAFQLPCKGYIFLKEIKDGTFSFEEQDMTGANSCVSGGNEFLHLAPNGSLSWTFQGLSSSGEKLVSIGMLQHP